ncbi:MAG: hypothetical protein GQ526_07730 [Ardenticatenales bacterium]|nr:hypothetical protein [Ardenticatenales bacterium]
MKTVVCTVCCKPHDPCERGVAALEHLVDELKAIVAGVLWQDSSGTLQLAAAVPGGTDAESQ